MPITSISHPPRSQEIDILCIAIPKAVIFAYDAGMVDPKGN